MFNKQSTTKRKVLSKRYIVLYTKPEKSIIHKGCRRWLPCQYQSVLVPYQGRTRELVHHLHKTFLVGVHASSFQLNFILLPLWLLSNKVLLPLFPPRFFLGKLCHLVLQATHLALNFLQGSFSANQFLLLVYKFGIEAMPWPLKVEELQFFSSEGRFPPRLLLEKLLDLLLHISILIQQV